MNDKRFELVERIIQAREKNQNLPGSEYDTRNTPNDWVSIVAHYVTDDVRRGGTKPDKDVYEENLIKAAGVILAALEHVDVMANAGHFE